jgi:predicted N-acetyltransferase YhbS
MELIIRKANKSEHYRTEYITREAFWNIYKPGCDEHLVLNKLRNSGSYIPELDLIAIYKQELVGHILSTKAKVIDMLDKEHQILCVGPLTVLPGFQGKGIGSQLISASVRQAKELGYPGMILYGNPAYYHRFGFVNAQKYGISTKDNQNFDPFMALEINKNSLTNISGRFFEDEAFFVEEAELTEFEKQFQWKEKRITDTQFKH